MVVYIMMMMMMIIEIIYLRHGDSNDEKSLESDFSLIKEEEGRKNKKQEE